MIPRHDGGDELLALATEATDAALARDEGIDLVLLPPYSPDLQPAERRWPLVDEPVVNRAVPTLDAREAVLVARCRTLEADPARLEAHARFHCWPREPTPAVRQ